MEDLDCPHVVGIDRNWILDQLVNPSEERTKIIAWLLRMIEPTMLVSIDTTAHFDNESLRKDLLMLLSSLGFCGPDRMDLIKGTASKRDQLQLFSLLLDVVEVSHSEGLPSDLDDVWQKQDHFVHQIATHATIMKSLLSHKVNLLPSEVAARIMKNQQRNTEDLSKNRIADLVKGYESTLETLQQELAEKSQELEVIKDMYVYNPFTSEELTEVCHKLDVVVTNMNQHLEKFHTCYDNELVSWCRMPDTPPTELGTILDRLYTKMDSFALMMGTFESIRATTLQLEDLDTVKPGRDTTLKTASDSFFLTLTDFLNQIAVPAVGDQSADGYLSV
ncbi:uncharacterized protein LOC115225358 isoform X2 [Octopus sinensis]|uniref:Uncharacterized protein LOC115225358 isoform X2 n=1 Tax=Octopus sinensis TaxID=2607531 RepID=A0A7E6FT17_9MOLL|nr:uncharacterized protein LOC115225358 isoform X2 [Octopus sinensis]